MSKYSFRQKSLTLTEVLVTVIIVAIIAGVSIPAYKGIIEKQVDKEAFAALETIAQAENRYFVKHNDYYPDRLGDTVEGLDLINTNLNLRIPDTGNWDYTIYLHLEGGIVVYAERQSRHYQIELRNGMEVDRDF